MRGWQRLGEVPPAQLANARLQLHWAVQALAYAGSAWTEPADDDSHMALAWGSAPVARLRSQPSARGGRRVQLDVTSLVLAICGPKGGGDGNGKSGGDGDGDLEASFPLRGRSFAEALAWVAAAVHPGMAAPARFPPYDMPAHPVGAGAVFDADAADLAELARWYHDGDLLLRGVQAATPGASPVRCWPHHFDIATLVTVAPGRTVGVGLSPGDGSFAEPYLYVTPSPYPDDAPDAPLPGGGRWHRGGWFGAVLTGGALVTSPDAAAQAERAHELVGAAVKICRTLLTP